MWSTGINRNIVECKDDICHRLKLIGISINRNIVECKVFLTFSCFLRQFRINRNIVECKGDEPQLLLS